MPSYSPNQNPDEKFLLIGDLNASPRSDQLVDGKHAIKLILSHPRINDSGHLQTSKGALQGRKSGSPNYFERSTAGFGDGHRIDYILPSKNLNPVSGGVYWPDANDDPKGAEMAEKASDHYMIWLDLKID